MSGWFHRISENLRVSEPAPRPMPPKPAQYNRQEFLQYRFPITNCPCSFLSKAEVFGSYPTRDRHSVGLSALFQKGKPHGFPLFQKGFRTGASQIANTGNISGSLGDTDGPPGIQQVECMGTFQAILIGRKNQ